MEVSNQDGQSYYNIYKIKIKLIMNFHIVSIFPEIYESFLKTSIINKAIKREKININIYNPRELCENKHKQIDDEIYWVWAWMLIKAKPIIDNIENIIKNLKTNNFKIIYLTPSDKILDQEKVFNYSSFDDIILICGRYEWIDYRFEEYFKDNYLDKFERLSIWKYILMWWEVASMVFIESVSRIIDWVLWEKESFINESYAPNKENKNIEYPQYTRPQNVYWYTIPEELLSWNHSKIEERKNKNEKRLK